MSDEVAQERVTCRDCVVEEKTMVPCTRFFDKSTSPRTEVLYDDWFFAAQEAGIPVDKIGVLLTPKGRYVKGGTRFMNRYDVETRDEETLMPVSKSFGGTVAQALEEGWTSVEHGGFLCPDCSTAAAAEDPEPDDHGARLDEGVTSVIGGAVFTKEILTALGFLGDFVTKSEDPNKTFGVLVRALAVVSFPRKKVDQ